MRFPPLVLLTLLGACAQVPAVTDDLYKLTLEPTLATRRASEQSVPFAGSEPLGERIASSKSDVEQAQDGSDQAQKTPAPSPIGDATRYSLDLRGVPVAQALQMIAEKAKINLYIDGSLDTPIDASFPAITLDEALAVILDRHGLELIEDPPGVYWVERRDGTQTETRVVRLESIHASDIEQHLNSLIGPNVDLVVDANQNIVLMRGPAANLDLATTYLEEADRLRPQVLIEVEILEVSLSDEYEFGIQTALEDAGNAGDSLFGSIDVDLSTQSQDFTAVLSNASGSISAVVNALSTFGTVNVVSSPRVLAVTNTEANIEVITEIPYLETTTEIQTGTGTSGLTSQQTVAYKEAGVKLKVTPIVQEGGVISLHVDQEFSESIDIFQGIPVIDTRKVVTTLLVSESETAMIGGLIQDKRTEQQRGVPGLMHVPLLGRFFRSDQESTSRRELIVLLRPRLADPSEAARLAREYHHRYIQRVRAAGIASESGDER